MDLLAAQVPGMLASVVPETERPAVMPRCGESDAADSALLPTQVREPPGKRGAATRFKRQAARPEFVSATDLGGVLLSQQELVAVLHKRPEWEEHRRQVHIAWKNAVHIVHNISRRESPDCPKRWRSTYFLRTRAR